MGNDDKIVVKHGPGGRQHLQVIAALAAARPCCSPPLPLLLSALLPLRVAHASRPGSLLLQISASTVLPLAAQLAFRIIIHPENEKVQRAMMHMPHGATHCGARSNCPLSHSASPIRPALTCPCLPAACEPSRCSATWTIVWNIKCWRLMNVTAGKQAFCQAHCTDPQLTLQQSVSRLFS